MPREIVEVEGLIDIVRRKFSAALKGPAKPGGEP